VVRAASLLLVALSTVSAAEPSLTHLYPAAGQQGTTVSVTASGKFDPWPAQVWVDAPGVAFTATKTKGKFDVAIAKDAAPGPHLVRVFNQDGASIPRFFIVSTEPELAEIEPNDDFQSPQRIASLPATISGRLDKPGDVDSFGVTLKKGETLNARVEAYVLASSFDAMLRIVDPNGVELAFDHDDGQTLDPNLSWEAPHDGTFVVQLMGFAYPATADVHLTGGEGCVYRLHLTTAPQPRFHFPPSDPTQGPEIVQEHGSTETGGQIIPIPCFVSGCLAKPGEEDHFAFTAVKQKNYTFQVISARAGAPLDAWVAVENKDGQVLRRNDDTDGQRDPQLTWTAPSDGVFQVVLGDVTHHGGPDFVYRLTVAEAPPSATGTATSHAITVVAGKTAEIKTAVKFANGFKTKLHLAAKNLPAGVSAAEVEVPEKGGEVTLKMSAAADAPAASQPVQLVLRETESGGEHRVIYPMTTSGENNGVPQAYTELVINSTDQLWLTVTSTTPVAVADKTEATK